MPRKPISKRFYRKPRRQPKVNKTSDVARKTNLHIMLEHSLDASHQGEDTSISHCPQQSGTAEVGDSSLIPLVVDDHNYASSYLSQGNTLDASSNGTANPYSETEPQNIHISVKQEEESLHTSLRIDSAWKKINDLYEVHNVPMSEIPDDMSSSLSSKAFGNDIMPIETSNDATLDIGMTTNVSCGSLVCNAVASSMKKDPSHVEEYQIEDLLSVVRSRVTPLLPIQWILVVKDGGVHVGLMARTNVFLIQRSIFNSTCGNVKIHIHGKPLFSDHELYKKMSRVQLCSDTVEMFSENIVKAVFALRLYEVCQGVQDFSPLWNLVPDSVIDENNFRERRFSRCLRSSKCLLLVPSLSVRRCCECRKIWRYLSVRSRRESQPTSDLPSDYKPHKYLSASETESRLRENRKMIKNLRMANKRLRSKILNIAKQSNVVVDQDEVSDI